MDKLEFGQKERKYWKCPNLKDTRNGRSDTFSTLGAMVRLAPDKDLRGFVDGNFPD